MREWMDIDEVTDSFYRIAAKGYLEPVVNRNGRPAGGDALCVFTRKQLTALRAVFDFPVYRKSHQEVLNYANKVLARLLWKQKIWDELDRRVKESKAH